MPRAISETWAGLGLPLGLLWMIGWLAARGRPNPSTLPMWVIWTRRLIWPLLLFFLSQTGTYQIARYLAPYYPFLLIPFLFSMGWPAVFRRPWWRWSSRAVFGISLGLVLLSRQRPVLPTPGITRWLAEHGPARSYWKTLAEKQLMQQFLYRRFNEFLPRLQGERLVGVAAFSTGETSLWQPYGFASGDRRVHYIRNVADIQIVRSQGMRYVIQNDIGAMVSGTLDGLEWAERSGGRVVGLIGMTHEQVLERRQLPMRPTLEEISRSRLGSDGKLLVDTIYLVEWDPL